MIEGARLDLPFPAPASFAFSSLACVRALLSIKAADEIEGRRTQRGLTSTTKRRRIPCELHQRNLVRKSFSAERRRQPLVLRKERACEKRNQR